MVNVFSAVGWSRQGTLLDDPDLLILVLPLLSCVFWRFFGEKARFISIKQRKGLIWTGFGLKLQEN